MNAIDFSNAGEVPLTLYSQERKFKLCLWGQQRISIHFFADWFYVVPVSFSPTTWEYGIELTVLSDEPIKCRQYYFLEQERTRERRWRGKWRSAKERYLILSRFEQLDEWWGATLGRSFQPLSQSFQRILPIGKSWLSMQITGAIIGILTKYSRVPSHFSERFEQEPTTFPLPKHCSPMSRMVSRKQGQVIVFGFLETAVSSCSQMSASSLLIQGSVERSGRPILIVLLRKRCKHGSNVCSCRWLSKRMWQPTNCKFGSGYWESTDHRWNFLSICSDWTSPLALQQLATTSISQNRFALSSITLLLQSKWWWWNIHPDWTFGGAIMRLSLWRHSKFGKHGLFNIMNRQIASSSVSPSRVHRFWAVFFLACLFWWEERCTTFVFAFVFCSFDEQHFKCIAFYFVHILGNMVVASIPRQSKFVGVKPFYSGPCMYKAIFGDRHRCESIDAYRSRRPLSAYELFSSVWEVNRV